VYRILIVDDHPIVRHGLGELIDRQDDLEVCGEAANISEALQQVATSHPHLAIVDISLEQESGIELIKILKTRYPHIKVLVSSMHDEATFAPRAFQAGARGYISKQESIRSVIDAVREMLQSGAYLSSQMAKRLVCRVARREKLDQDPVRNLTDRELQVFEMIGGGLDTRQIASKLHRSPRTIETHRKNIKVKLNLRTSAELSRTAFLWCHENRPPSVEESPTGQ
jgi:DNA-binding NarL/FixJ family response regulator